MVVAVNADSGYVCERYRKPALFDGLEVDQYVWGILQHLATNPHAVEVTIDHTASWRPLDPGQFIYCLVKL